MPKIPKLIGTLVKTAWSKMFINVKVVEKTQLTDSLLKIRFQGDLSETNYEVGQAILMQISATEYRNYSPSIYCPEQGYFEVLFHQKAKGPGTKFFKNIKENDIVTTSIPRGQNMYDHNMDYHFFYGDESCLGFCNYLQSTLKKENKKLKGILELEPANANYAHSLLDNIDIIEPYLIDKAETAIDYLSSIDDFNWNRIKNGQFYIMGNAKSISTFRKALKDKGVSNRNIVTQPFWVEGKVGL